MKPKFIFLDIDGVLNNHRFIMENSYLKESEQKLIDEQKMVLLKNIIEATRAKIVLSSSWRDMFDENMSPRTKRASEIMALFQAYGLELWSRTQDQSDKMLSIEKWIKSHRSIIDRFIIIDDDFIYDNREMLSRLVRTSYYIGLTEQHVSAAIHMLKDEEPCL